MDERGWTLAELARQLDESPPQVTRLAYGERRPGRRLASKLRELLGIPIETWDAPVPADWRLPHAA